MIVQPDLLQGLNPAQREAVETVDGPLLINAGPGSGKTRVITHRIAYIVHHCGVHPYRIMAATFTNKAAREMDDRLQRLVGTRAQSLSVGTFHAFCARLLRRDGEAMGLNRNYSIFDTDDQLSAIKQSMELAEVDPKGHPPRAILGVISRAKNVLSDSRGLARRAENYFEKTAARVYHHYEEIMARNNAVDFDDLLMKSVQLLEEYRFVREHYQDRYVHVMVDEFQDTNVAQYRLARLLAGDRQNICVVGDPDQSIYSWRSADIRNIPNFQRDYPGCKIIFLEQNYRSTSNILDAAQSVISNNRQRPDKRLFTENGDGVPVYVHETYNEEDEAGYVIGEADRLVREKKVKAGDCAIMYRVNAQSRALEEACLRRGMKYRLVGGVRFYQRKEVKDLLAFLRLVHNPLDDVSLMRVINVPPRGIGAKSVSLLTGWARDEGVPTFTAMQRILGARREGQPCPVKLPRRAANSIADFANLVEDMANLSVQLPASELIGEALELAGFRQHYQNADGRAADRSDGQRPEERWENLMELRETAREFDAEDPADGLASLLERISLVAEVDNYEESEDSLTLITLHQAKGLEFPVVFIVGLEEGILPHYRSIETDAQSGTDAQVEEERRLCYVGMTRAQQRLYLLRAFRRGFMGSSGPTNASRFLGEIPEDLLASPDQSRPSDVTAAKSTRQSPAMFQIPDAPAAPAKPAPGIGETVRHSSFGEGVVIDCLAIPGDHEVTVHFAGSVGIKRLLLSYAPLEKVPGDTPL